MEKKLSLPSLQLFRQLVDHGHRTAVVTSQSGFSLTYREVLREANRVSERLGGQVSSSSRPPSFRPIALLAPRDHTFCVGHMAVLQAGGAVVPIHSRNPPAETEYILRDSGCQQILLHPQLRPALEPVLRCGKGLAGLEVVDLEVDESRAHNASTLPSPSYGADQGNNDGAPPRPAAQEDVEWFDMAESADAMVVYTSGTTGRPKGVVKTHAQLADMCRAVVEAWAYSPADRVLGFLPLHHLHGLVNKFLAVLWAGGIIEFVSSTSATAIWQRLADPTKPSLTMFHAVPTIYALLLEELEATRLDEASQARALEHLRQMRLMVSGSAALPRSRFSEWEALTGHRLLERYGTTEAGMILGNPLTPASARFPGYVGAPFPGVEVRLVDPETGANVTQEPGGQGEVRVRSPHGLFSRYHNNGEATSEAFDEEDWYRTGDLGEFNPEKGFKILGRMSADILKSGGYKISALEIETAIQEHKWVAEVSVVGRPHPQWGDEVVAVVRLRDDDTSSSGGGSEKAGMTLDDLRTFLASRLAPYKLPRALCVVESLPKNAMGKVSKKTLLRDLGLAADKDKVM